MSSWTHQFGLITITNVLKLNLKIAKRYSDNKGEKLNLRLVDWRNERNNQNPRKVKLSFIRGKLKTMKLNWK